jgi:hypothetical protein
MATHQHVGAEAPGPLTPTSDNAPWQGRVEGNGTADSGDCALKSSATLRAQGALIGCSIYELQDSGYLLPRWNMHRELPDLAAVADLLRLMGAKP